MSTDTVLSGLLKDFGLVEVLQVMELGGMTGALHLKQASGHMGIIYFNEGKMANCSEFDPGALTLGDVLQQLGMTTYQHIEEAFSQQLQDPFGKRIGEHLIASSAISDKQLREALRTKALWTIRELSLWEEGTYDFLPAPDVQKLLPYGEVSLDIEVMRATMEMIRYRDEWDDLIKLLPQGMRTILHVSPTIPYTMRFDMRTLELFTHVNLYGRVRRIASVIRRPELDVARELAQFVQQKFLLVVPQRDTVQHGKSQMEKSDSRKVHLPEPAEKLRLENFELLNLISRMEQAWMKCRTPMEQLPAMVQFVNWTMDALADICRANETELDSNTLRSLMANEKLSNMGSYTFKVDQNYIDVESFTSLCYEVMSGDMKKAESFYDEATMMLHRLLCTIFALINNRVADPRERLENQEVWEAMFEQFALRPTPLPNINNTIIYNFFAITRITKGDDNRAFVGGSYHVQTGIAPNIPERFKGEAFNLILNNPQNNIVFDISLHTSKNIKIIGEWDKLLHYDSLASQVKITDFTIKIIAEGKCSLVIDFYHKRRWLKTTRLEFDVQAPQFAPISSEE